jgi:acyl-CoA thioesterase-1
VGRIMELVKKGDLILFIGDSVTDCGRNREDLSDLGPSYVKKIDSYLKAFFAELLLRVMNKGISGNRVIDLQARWQDDCLCYKPDIINILIGINDCWRRFDNNDSTSAEDFEKRYDSILLAAQKTGAKLTIMEPFVLPYPVERTSWREDLDPKIQAARKLACKYGAKLIPLDGIFASLIISKEPQFYSADGVHPTNAGHAVIAKAWLEAMKV